MKYDIIGEIKKSPDSHETIIDRVKENLQLIYNLQKSTDLIYRWVLKKKKKNCYVCAK